MSPRRLDRGGPHTAFRSNRPFIRALGAQSANALGLDFVLVSPERGAEAAEGVMIAVAAHSASRPDDRAEGGEVTAQRHAAARVVRKRTWSVLKEEDRPYVDFLVVFVNMHRRFMATLVPAQLQSGLRLPATAALGPAERLWRRQGLLHGVAGHCLCGHAAQRRIRSGVAFDTNVFAQMHALLPCARTGSTVRPPAPWQVHPGTVRWQGRPWDGRRRWLGLVGSHMRSTRTWSPTCLPAAWKRDAGRPHGQALGDPAWRPAKQCCCMYVYTKISLSLNAIVN